MKPRRTHYSNSVLRLPGGNEDNDLWVTRDKHADSDDLVRCSTWEPTDDERKAIANGENIELIVWGEGHPPVAIRTNNYPLGAPPVKDG